MVKIGNDLFNMEIEDTDGFLLFTKLLGGGEYLCMDREQLTELRAIIDQALNTSIEELEASGE